ncbi:TetR/AcrR family transcriptional regulator C-terminal domain-containing protein [Uniformispora flossi]|uniref:TetR/AcrR family transcriptional regulator C-terminal domain-containing protein n=1 Tax=Uniformispora flossi TaxID=3390723 RepID=UPI003C2BF382
MTQPREVKSAERGSVTRDALARAGLAVLQRDGLDALSMRAVAAELGVRAPSLYWHVRSKEELLDLLGDALMLAAAPDLPVRSGDWRTDLGAIAWGFREFLRVRRDAVRVLAGRFLHGPGMWTVMEQQLEVLHDAGFSRQDATLASYTLGITVTGFMLNEQAAVSAAEAEGRLGRRAAVDEIADLIEGLPADRYPHLVASARAMAGPDMDERFRFVVDRFLDGLEALPRTLPT